MLAILNDLNKNNIATYKGKYIELYVTKSNKVTKPNVHYYIEFKMKAFDTLKQYPWYKYLEYSFKYNSMIMHIYNQDLLESILKDATKLDNLYCFT